MGEHCKHRAYQGALKSHFGGCERCSRGKGGADCKAFLSIMDEHGAFMGDRCGCRCKECRRVRDRYRTRPVREIAPSDN